MCGSVSMRTLSDAARVLRRTRPRADHPIATWRDAFFADPQVGLAEARDDGAWIRWTALLPSSPGLLGDTLTRITHLRSVVTLPPPYNCADLLLDLATYADMPETETRASGAGGRGAPDCCHDGGRGCD